MFQHHIVNRNKNKKINDKKVKRHSEFVNPVQWQTHLLWGLPSQKGNSL